jgi:hypothetical protein
VKVHFKIALETGTLPIRIRPWCRHDELPYKIHTGRELALMLKGTKPLAHFTGQYPPDAEVEEIPERLFDPYVGTGRFVKREHVVPSSSGRSGRIRRVYYALPEEQWRIDAFILLLETAAKSGWSEGFERMEGALLGYEDWQNDIFIDRIYKRM